MRGDQVFELPFKTVCNGYCKRNNIHPLSLYTIMQQGICDDMSRRSQSSSLFRNLLDKVKNDWGYEEKYLPDIFVVRNVDFDEDHIANENNYLNSLKENYDAINANITDNDDHGSTYDTLLSLKSDVSDCLERNGNHLITLNQDCKSPYCDLWGDMSTLMKSDYLESLQDDNDSNVMRYATKKINKEIPDETPQIFTNLNLLEILKIKKIEEYKRTIKSIIQQLQNLSDDLDNVLNAIPKPMQQQSTGKSWLSYLMGGDVSDQEDEEDYMSTDSEEDIRNAQDELKEALGELENYEPNDVSEIDIDDNNDPDDANEADEADEADDADDADEADEVDEGDENTFVLSLDNKATNKYNFF